MLTLFKSATRTVLIVMTFSFCILTFLNIVDPKDFVTAMFMVLSFYFWKTQSPPVTEETNAR